MKSALYWFMFGVCVTFGAMMIVFGVVFLREAYFSVSLSRGEMAFPTLLLGILLLLVGGGLLSSSIATSFRKVCSR
jgi:hypothetical protein